MATKTKTVMTYRDRTQDIIRKIWLLYDEAGHMRDFASDGPNKDAWNKTRGMLYDTAIKLGNHDNSISGGTAAMETWSDDDDKTAS
ncbi:MAG TPA: hypothetical protein VK609_22985 [Mucilaginibacter sp.]|nr:hypothetical protein [Mucilaginibacter sp.]